MRVRSAIAIVALLAVSACTSSEPGSTKPTFGGGPAPTYAPDDLAAAKQAAGIEDCPDGKEPAADLPDITLDCLGGGTPVDLSDLGGTPTVINLWASWCAPCRKEMPILAKADGAYDGKVRFIGIDFKDSAPDDALELAGSTGVTYPLLADPDQRTARAFGVLSLPVTVFVDAQGRMVHTERDEFRSYADLTAAIDEHLGVTP